MRAYRAAAGFVLAFLILPAMYVSYVSRSFGLLVLVMLAWLLGAVSFLLAAGLAASSGRFRAVPAMLIVPGLCVAGLAWLPLGIPTPMLITVGDYLHVVTASLPDLVRGVGPSVQWRFWTSEIAGFNGPPYWRFLVRDPGGSTAGPSSSWPPGWRVDAAAAFEANRHGGDVSFSPEQITATGVRHLVGPYYVVELGF